LGIEKQLPLSPLLDSLLLYSVPFISAFKTHEFFSKFEIAHQTENLDNATKMHNQKFALKYDIAVYFFLIPLVHFKLATESSLCLFTPGLGLMVQPHPGTMCLCDRG